MQIFLTRDRQGDKVYEYVDVWFGRPWYYHTLSDDKKTTGIMWEGNLHVGEYRIDIVERVFGRVPENEVECVSVTVGLDKIETIRRAA